MIQYITYIVTDIDKVTEAWSGLYGIEPWTFKENGGTDGKGRPWKIRMAFSYVESIEIKLIQFLEGRNLQAKFIGKWGEDVHHIGFCVEDVDAEVNKLVEEGATLLFHDPGRFASLDVGGPGGAVFEFMKRQDFEERCVCPSFLDGKVQKLYLHRGKKDGIASLQMPES